MTRQEIARLILGLAGFVAWLWMFSTLHGCSAPPGPNIPTYTPVFHDASLGGPHDLGPTSAPPDEAADAAPATDQAPALADLRSATDLVQAMDLAPPVACGGVGQPCCATGAECGPAMLCLVAGDVCSAQEAKRCVYPVNCGTGNGQCCDDAGHPATSGMCERGLYCNITLARCIVCG